MEIRVFGPFEVETARGRLELRGEKRRGLLALFVVHAGEALSRHRIVEALWGQDAPGADSTVQTYVSQLRKQLPGHAKITTVGRGYRFDVQRKVIDLCRFRDAAVAAKSATDLDERRSLLVAALAEWRGEPLEEFAGLAWADETARMAAEQRLELLQQRVETDLRLGRAREVVGELAEVVHAHPLVEPFWAQYMLALYLCGRQSDALRAYSELRATLADELGIEPSRALVELELRILDHDDTLLEVGGPTTQARRDVGLRRQIQDALPPLLSTTSSTDLVGREPELETLAAEWRGAQQGRASIVLVSGEPGVGKTRLVTEFAKTCHRAAAVVLGGGCEETVRLPFRPFTDALAHYVAQTPPEALSDQLGPSAPLVARIIPSLSQRLEIPPEPVSRTALEEQRAELIDAIARWLAAMTAAGPVVVVLDDLQWADATALSVLRALSHSAQSLPLLILATYRSRDIPKGHPLVETLADLRRDRPVTRLGLSGLPLGATQLLIDRLANGDRVTDSIFTEELHSVTAGNPFFVLEMIRHFNETHWPLAEGARQPRGHRPGRLGLPEGLREVLNARLAKLPDSTYDLLQAAAVVGRSFDLAVIAAVVGVDEDAALHRLTAALTVGLITEDPAVVDRFQFEHVLVQEALGSALSASHRVRLHLRVAQEMKRLAATHDDERLSELAYHYGEAVTIGCADEAITYGLRAADQAIDAYAFEDAIQHLERTLNITRTYQPSALTEAKLCRMLTSAYEGANDLERAEESAEAAIDAARRAGPAASLEFAAAVYALHAVRSWMGPAAWEQLIPLMREAIDGLEPDQIPLRITLLGHMSTPQTNVTSPEERTATATEAVDLARSSNSDFLLAQALSAFVMAHSGPDHLQQFRTAVTELETTNITGQGMRPSEFEALEGILQGRLHGALRAGSVRTARTVIDLARKAANAPYYEYYSIHWDAMLFALEGRWTDAEASALAALDLRQKARTAREATNSAVIYMFVQLLQVRIAQGRLDEVVSLLSSLLESPTADEYGTARLSDAIECTLANVHMLLGHSHESHGRVKHLIDRRLDELDRSNTLWYLSVSQLADACVGVGDAERAAVLYNHIAQTQRLNIVVGLCSACDGAFDRVLGRLAGITEQWDLADQHFVDSRILERGLESPPLTARTDLHHAEMLLRAQRRGDSERARELLAQASRAATVLDMPLLQRQVHALLPI